MNSASLFSPCFSSFHAQGRQPLQQIAGFGCDAAVWHFVPYYLRKGRNKFGTLELLV